MTLKEKIMEYILQSPGASDTELAVHVEKTITLDIAGVDMKKIMREDGDQI